MAYISSTDKDDEKDQGLDLFSGQGQLQPQNQQGQQAQGEPVSLTSSPGSIQGGAPAQPAPQQNKQKGSGAFTDLRKYVQANKPQASQLGQAAASTIQKQAGQIGGQVAKANEQYQQNIAQQQQQIQQAQQFGQQQIQQAAQGKAAATPNLQQFQQIATGQKTFGDAGALNLAAQQQAAQKVAGFAGQAERATGVNQMLQQAFGKNQYTGGQKALDAMILGGDRNARQQLMTDVQKASTGLESQLRDARSAALAEASKLSTQDQALRDTLGTQLTGARSQVTKDIEANTAAVQKKLADEQNYLMGKLQKGEISVEDFNKYIDQSQLQAAAQQFGQTRSGLAERLQSPEYSKYASDPEFLQQQVDTLRNLGVSEQQIADQFRQTALGQLEGLGSGNINNAQNLYKTDQIGSLLKSFYDPTTTTGQLQQAGYTQLNAQQLRDQLTQMTPQELLNKAMSGYTTGGGVSRFTPVGDQTAVKDRMDVLNQVLQGVQTPTTASLAQRAVADINRAAQQGQDVTKYLSKVDPKTISSSQAITDDLLARQQALAALAGRQGEGVQRQGSVPAKAATFNFADILKNVSGIKV